MCGIFDAVGGGAPPLGAWHAGSAQDSTGNSVWSTRVGPGVGRGPPVWHNKQSAETSSKSCGIVLMPSFGSDGIVVVDGVPLGAWHTGSEQSSTDKSAWSAGAG